MCGICGAISLNGSDGAIELVRRMTPTMVHRGPNDEGYLSSGALALGMRRLSIIDLFGGHQPIFNEDGSVAVVVNGEIYNFRELKDHLRHRGHTFSTHADSEVIAHAYEEWGPDCVHHLQGMFAFAVFDSRYAFAGSEGTLFLARDRLGIKPLYYCQPIADCGLRIADLKNHLPRNHDHGNSENASAKTNPQSANRNPQFLFASEVRTLLASGVVPRRVSRSALQSFLLFGSVSEPETLVEGVYSLPPGHRMTIRLGSADLVAQPESYWNLGYAAAQDGHDKGELKRASGRVRELLEASVRRLLIADVPVGVFLSGGIDSTALAALASREVSGIHTFTVAFAETEFNEAHVARRTAESLGTKHQELVLTTEQMLARLGEAVGALDQPSMDGINTYFVSWAAKQAGLKVALSGLGGDEVFGGYSTFKRTPHLQRIASLGSHVPDSLRAAMAAVVTGAGDGFAPGDAARKIAALWNDPESLPDTYFFSRALFTPPQVSALLQGRNHDSEKFFWWNWLSESARHARKLDAFTAVSCMESQSYLVNTLLRDTDSMSMAHSLEVRVPFLDHELVEFVSQLPESIKLRKSTPKALLIAALSDVLPAEVVNQTKRGFTFPWATWLKGPLKATVEKGLSDFSPALAEMLDTSEVREVWSNYLQGHTSWSRPWSLYVLNEWVKRHL
jgi:asparagine synthase (glutamine-hydrolysing)